MGRRHRGCPWGRSRCPSGGPRRSPRLGRGAGAAGPSPGRGGAAAGVPPGAADRGPARAGAPRRVARSRLPTSGRCRSAKFGGCCRGELSAPRGAGRARSCPALRPRRAERRAVGGGCRAPGSGAGPALAPPAAAPGAGLRAGDARGGRGRRCRHGGERDRHGSARPAAAIGSAVAISYGSRGAAAAREPRASAEPAPVRRDPCPPQPCSTPSARAGSREHLWLERGNGLCQTCRTEGEPSQMFRSGRDGLF